MGHDLAVEPVSQSSAYCTHITLLQDSSTLDTSHDDSSTSAASGCQADELAAYAQTLAGYGDNLVPNGMPFHTALQKGDKKEKEAMLSNKADHNELDADDSFGDTAHQSAKILVDEFMKTHPLPLLFDAAKSGDLPCPVIIPQRRPRDWTRGFMRAYAPVLADCGISQDIFLDFLKTFHAVNRHLPLLKVVNSAAWKFVAMSMPFVACMFPNLARVIPKCRQENRSFYYSMRQKFVFNIIGSHPLPGHRYGHKSTSKN